MNRALFASLVLFSFVAVAGQEPVRITYASWNIGHFALGNAQHSLVDAKDAAARAAAYRLFLNEVGADFLGVCEFSDGFTRDGRQKAVETVFPKYPSRHVGPPQSHGWHQNAQFWKTGERVSSCVRQCTRRCDEIHWLETRLGFGTQEVVFVQTHLDWKPVGDTVSPFRQAEMREIIDAYRSDPCVVISGDFNVGIRRRGPDGKRTRTENCPDEYCLFTDAGYTLGNDGRFKTVQDGCALDNIIVKGVKISGFKVWDRYDLSDHALVSALIELIPKE